MGQEKGDALPSLPEHSSHGYLFWRSRHSKESQPLKGGNHERSWLGSALHKAPSVDLPKGTGRHSRTHSLDDGPVLQNGEIGGMDVAAAKKGHHRRAGSFSSFLRKNLGLRKRGDSVGSADELEQMESVFASTHDGPGTSSRFAPSGRTPTIPGAVPSRAASGSMPSVGALACFGLGTRGPGELENDGAEQVSAPGTARQSMSQAGSVPNQSPTVVISNHHPPVVQPLRATGIRNLGNTCFVNTALQCLRHTPGLAARLAPDLERQMEEKVKASMDTGTDAAVLINSQIPSSSVGLLEEPGSVDVHALASAGTDRSGVLQAFLPEGDEPGEGQKDECDEAESGRANEVEQSLAEPEVHAEECMDGGAAKEEVTVAETLPSVSYDNENTGAVPEEKNEAVIADEEGQNNAVAGKIEEETVVAEGSHDSNGSSDVQVISPDEKDKATSPALTKPPRPAHGELLTAFLQLLVELYLHSEAVGLDPTHFIRMLKRYPMATDFLDGGQHDCQEVLRVLMDLLHDDLRPPRLPAEEAAYKPAMNGPSSSGIVDGGNASPARSESEKAQHHWASYLAKDASVVTELFGGQLQSSITCHKCGRRFTMYEPFWDLSLPLAKEGKQSSLAWLGIRGSPASIKDCLAVYAADEKLEGEEAFSCETCRAKTPATKHLRIHRLPQILVLHIKRFKYRGFFTDKLTASVSYPLSSLSLDGVLSPEALAEGQGGALYDLYAVSNHYGNLTGGHYTAMCRTVGGTDDGWYCFNDEIVNRVSEDQVMSQYAYILFYARRPGTGGE